jgi:cysteine synthase A
VIPETQSQEKKDTLRFCGAQLIEVPAMPFANPANYVQIAARLARALQEHPDRPCRVVYANQWDNTANRLAHIEGTGPEILAQTRGAVDAFSCAMGTGGTLAGVAAALRAAKPDVVIGLTDPQGAVPVTYFTTGTPTAGAGSSISEGIGQGRITGNMAGFRPDFTAEIDDAAAMRELNALTLHEGLQVGLSSGINVAGAVKLAEKLGPGKTIVTVLCDSAMRYTGKMYNPSFLRTKGLPVPAWLDEANTRFVADGMASAGEAPTAQALLPFDLASVVSKAIEGTEIMSRCITKL